MSNLTGQTLGRYHILEPLGEGGMAIVYKAYDTRLENEVAVKVIRTERLSAEILQKALKRFEREAKSLAQLTHPNIVNVLDYGDYEGQPYLVMPYVPGGTLKQLLNGKPMQWQKAARLLIPIARSLDYAHKRGVVHRDIKPSNIMITESGEPMLTDFGVAKIIDEEATLDLTGTSAAVGTPEYMAPEQTTSKTTDHRVDIYALGIVLYEMVTGRKPFQADTPLAVLFKHASEPLPRPSQFVKDIPDSVEKILVIALAKKPTDRYQSMGEVADALDALLSGIAPTSNISRPKKEPASLSTHELGPVSKPSITLWVILATVGIAVIALLMNLKARGSETAEVIPTYTPPFTTSPLTTQTLSITNTPFATNTPQSTETPKLGIGSTITGEDEMALMYVPAGEFTMGSESGYDDEKPVHAIYLDAFWIDQTEVTNKQYADCVLSEGCTPPAHTYSYTHDSYYGNSQYNDYPIIYVDWNQAKAYCEWAGRRLPTEAEWEKAARGVDGRTYPWGENEPNVNLVNFNGIFDDTTQVNKYQNSASPYGAYNMSGNVEEWVEDWYSEIYYQSSPFSNPTGPASGQYRVLRGGSGVFYGGDVRSSYRHGFNPSNSYKDIGFRCARSN